MGEMKRHQGGAALLVSLVLLLVMTVLAISSMQSTSLQEGMVSAQRDSQVSFEGAEHALREAELFLSGIVPTFEDKNGLYTANGPAPMGADLFKPTFWTDNNSQVASMPKSGGKDLLAERPRFFVQLLDVASLTENASLGLNVQNYNNDTGETERQVFRIVARSLGRTGQSPRLVEEYFVREL